MAFTAKMAFSPPKYCRLFAQKKACQEGSRAPQDPPPPLATPLSIHIITGLFRVMARHGRTSYIHVWCDVREWTRRRNDRPPPNRIFFFQASSFQLLKLENLLR